MFHLIAIGDPLIDTHVQIADNCDKCEIHKKKTNKLCFNYGEKIPIIDSFQSLGGNAPNVAVGTVVLGMTSSLISSIGDDAYGHLALEELRQRGVDTKLVNIDKKNKTRYAIVLNYRGERTILSYSEKKNYRWPTEMPGASWIYYTGLSAGFEPIQQKLISFLKKNKQTKLAINPGSYLLKYAPNKIKEMLPLTNLLIVNADEAAKITGKKIKSEKDIEKCISVLLTMGAEEVVLTDGIRGSWAATKKEFWRLKSFPTKVVAKTGAGDAFSAAYIAAKFYKHDMPTALLWGTANSTSVIEQHGPHDGLLDEKGIKKMMKRFSSVQPQRIK
jgi:sugar/nucleoside kinase (ribokinase family)